MAEVMTMKKITSEARKEDVDLVLLAEAIHEYLSESSCVISCEDGDGRFVSLGAVNHAMNTLKRATEKALG